MTIAPQANPGDIISLPEGDFIIGPDGNLIPIEPPDTPDTPDEPESDLTPLRYHYTAVDYADAGAEGTIGLACGPEDGGVADAPLIALAAIDFEARDISGSESPGFGNEHEIFICAADKDTGVEATFRVQLKEGGQRGHRKGLVQTDYYTTYDTINIEVGSDIELIFVPLSKATLTNAGEIKNLDGKIDRVESDLTARIDDIELGGDFVTEVDFLLDQKRQDDALTAERATRAQETAELDQNLKALDEANEIEHSDLRALIDSIEGGGKESQPYIDFEQFKVIERSDRYDYDPLYHTNPIASHTWRYEIDLVGSGGFAPVDQLSEGLKNDIGWYGSMSNTHLRLKKTEAQKRLYPDAVMRFVVESDLNGKENIDHTCSLPAWDNGECVFNFTADQFQARVRAGEELQESLVIGLRGEQYAREDADIKLLAEINHLKAHGSEAAKAAIKALEEEDVRLKEALEAERNFRIAENAAIKAGLVEEARIRADEDYKLLARINGLEIPEMPKDYDDSGLRELIEQESALRATGDAGLQRLIEDNTSLINDTNEALGAERVTRAEQVAKLHADIEQETAARERGDSDLQAQIDALEVPENFEETIERLDNDIKVTNEKIDFNAEETLKDQERQDKDLADYKEEIKAEQEAQDARLEALEAIDPVNVLNDLNDVDVAVIPSGLSTGEMATEGYIYKLFLFDTIRGPASNVMDGQISTVIYNTHELQLARYDVFHHNVHDWVSDYLELGNHINLLYEYKGVRYEESFEYTKSNYHSGAPAFIVPEDLGLYQLINTLNKPDSEDIIVEVFSSKDRLFEFELFWEWFEANRPSGGGGGSLPPGGPLPTGVYLGYDEATSTWVAKRSDDTGSSVDPGDYYTKAEVDASQAAQDLRIDANDTSNLVEKAPEDGKEYVQKDGVWTELVIDDVNLDGYVTTEELEQSQEAQDLVISDLSQGVTDLGEALQAETDARTSADEALQDQIDAIDVDVDLSDYVEKAGDVMTGNLGFEPPDGENQLKIESKTPYNWDGNAFGIDIDLSAGDTAKNELTISTKGTEKAIRVNDDGKASLELSTRTRLNPYEGASGNNLIFYAKDTNGDNSLTVHANGSVRIGKDVDNPFIASQDNDIATKAYVDAKSSPEGSDYVAKAGDVMTGPLSSPAYTVSGDEDTQRSIIYFNEGTLHELEARPADVGKAVFYDTSDDPDESKDDNDFGFTDVIFAKGKYIAVRDWGEKRIAHSTDGVSWVYYAEPSGNTQLQRWHSIAYNKEENVFVAVAQNADPDDTETNNGKQIMISSDAINWRYVSHPTTDKNNSRAEVKFPHWRHVNCDGGKFVVCGGVPTKNNNYILTSYDGEHWDAYYHQNLWHAECLWYDAKEGLYVITQVNFSNMEMMTSRDGITWTTYKGGELGSSAHGFVSIAYGNGVYLANTASYFYTSTSLTSGWTKLPDPDNRGWHNNTYFFDGIFYTTGDRHNLHPPLAYSRNNGRSWIDLDCTSSNSLRVGVKGTPGIVFVGYNESVSENTHPDEESRKYGACRLEGAGVGRGLYYDDELIVQQVDQERQDAQILQNAADIAELQTTKGQSGHYKCKSIKGLPDYAVRPGELVTDNSDCTQVTWISLGVSDLNGNTTRPISIGDIVEFNEAPSPTRDVEDPERGVKSTGERCRYKIKAGVDAGAMDVEYLDGTNNFMVNEYETVFIYPLNKETASKEYVDDTFMPIKGGKFTGVVGFSRGKNANTKQLEFSTNSGDYATNIYAHNGGDLRFRVAPGNDTSNYKTLMTFKSGGNKKGGISFGGDIDVDVSDGGTNGSGFRLKGDFKVKADGQSMGGSNQFEVTRANGVKYFGAITAEEHVATKKHVEDYVEDYVKDNAVAGFVITKSGGNYYIEEK